MTGYLYSEIKRLQIPPLYTNEEVEDPLVLMELQLLGFGWRWFVTECEIQDEDVLFFGYVFGDDPEWGYFRLSDLLSQPLPYFISEDFQPKPFSELKKELQR